MFRLVCFTRIAFKILINHEKKEEKIFIFCPWFATMLVCGMPDFENTALRKFDDIIITINPIKIYF